MYTAKGFVAHADFANNTPGVIAPLGEISKYSQTFAREMGSYGSTAYPKLTNFNFLSIDGTTKVVIPNIFADQILKISNHIYAKTLGSSGQIFIDVLLQELIQTFAAEATDFEAGTMVTDGTYWMPEWVSWRNTSDTTRTDNLVKIWYVDASFRSEYEEMEFAIVAPFANLDDFHTKTPAAIRTAIAAMLAAADVTANRIQETRGDYPETILRTDLFNYVDPTDSTKKTPSPWTTLIYGAAGNNIDSIKDALQNYILSNSAYGRDKWIVIFPDIFKRTEFIGVPMWQREAIPNRPSTPGIYSPIVDYVKDRALVKKIIPAYSGAHIDANVQAIGVNYKSLLIPFIGNIENRDGLYRFGDVFPDYINVAMESEDFNRMSDATAAWVQKIMPLVILAETASDYSTLPVGTTRLKRDGILYLVRSYNNVQYLIATKASVLANQ